MFFQLYLFIYIYLCTCSPTQWPNSTLALLLALPRPEFVSPVAELLLASDSGGLDGLSLGNTTLSPLYEGRSSGILYPWGSMGMERSHLN